MSMYNEVYRKCPECNTNCEIQISQIVLGFGEFNLDNPMSLIHLTVKELKMLKECVKDKKFYCPNCKHEFYFDYRNEEDEKIKLIKELLGT